MSGEMGGAGGTRGLQDHFAEWLNRIDTEGSVTG